ncbi:MAG: hypothetical protein JXA89_10525, partial [Anaerolineae bacterium]|nr:hypothetical protein [Anaerolineae bacterium]
YRHRHTDLWLDPLSVDESQVLVGHLLRVENLPPHLRGRILERAKGNPFHVEEMLHYWETHQTLLQVIIEPFEVCWTCYRLLQAIGDPRAPAVLTRAHDLVQARAAMLKEPAHRRAFLQKRKVNRDIVAKYERRSHRTKTIDMQRNPNKPGSDTTSSITPGCD